MILVILIDVGKERAGVDDQCDWGTSFLMMSSICSAIDPWPLAPAPAAKKVRRFGAPKYISIAVRVTSEIVTP
jgi:hypothetical protein